MTLMDPDFIGNKERPSYPRNADLAPQAFSYAFNAFVFVLYILFYVITWPFRFIIWGFAHLVGTFEEKLGLNLGWEWYVNPEGRKLSL